MDNPDIGSQFIAAIEKPIILVVAGRDMDWYNVGEIWHLLDKRMQIPVTLVDRNLMSDVNLSKYTHIIYAGGKYSNYSPKYMRGLNQWVDNGGTLIGIRQGADWIGKNILTGKDEKKKKWHKNNSSKSNGIIPIPEQHKTVTKRHYWLLWTFEYF